MSTHERRRRRWGILAIVLALLAAVSFWIAWTYRAPGTTSEAPEWTPDLTSQLGPVPQLPQACPADPEVFVPTHFTMDTNGRAYDVAALGLDDLGAAAAPPSDRPGIVGWFDESPMAGARAGKTLLTAHTYVTRTGLGNELNAGLLTEGDIVRLSDDAGHVACYQYTHAAKIWVAEYDPTSTAIYDNGGDPQIALVVCSDWNTRTRVSDARVIHYLRLLTGEDVAR